MATGFTDFSEYTTDEQPSDWTLRYSADSGFAMVRASVESGVTGGKVLRLNKTLITTGYYAASWDDVDALADADVEIVVKYKFNEDGTTQEFGGFSRGSGAAVSSSNLYTANVTRSLSQRRLTKRVSGTRTTMASASETPATNVWRWCRLRVNGSSIQARHWLDSESEPGTWEFSETDTAVTAAGWTGVVSGGLGGTQVDNVDVDVFGYGTGGDAAPKVGAATPVSFSGTVPTLNGTEGVAFSESVASYFSGTETPFTYSVLSGTLPDGLSLNTSTGVISGTPTTVETEAGIVIRATDTGTDIADTNSFSIVIASSVVPVDFDGTVPTLNGTEDVSFSEDLSSYFTGTETPFTYTLQSGALPAGLSLNASSGVISGTPTTAGTASGLVVRATDDATNTADTNSFSITIAAATTYVLRVDELLYTSPAKTTLFSGTDIPARVIDIVANTITGPFTIDIVDGVCEITDAAYETPDDTFYIWLLDLPLSSAFPATVVAA